MGAAVAKAAGSGLHHVILNKGQHSFEVKPGKGDAIELRNGCVSKHDGIGLYLRPFGKGVAVPIKKSQEIPGLSTDQKKTLLKLI